MSNESYQFTNTWFEGAAKAIWDELMPQIKPTRILEVGSYEGQSACYLIEKLGAQSNLEIHCIDNWEGGVEHQAGGSAQTNMGIVEERFHHNIRTALNKVSYQVELTTHKGFSDIELSKLLASGKRDYFDFVYIDGSHQAPDVLLDAILGFKLLKTNGVIAFDDYLWQEPLSYGTDPIRCPKMAIDAFTNIYCRKLKIISTQNLQLYAQKLSD